MTGGLNHCIFDRSGHLSHAPAHPQVRLTLRTATAHAHVPDVTPIVAAIIVHDEHVGTDLNALCVSGTQILVNAHLHRCKSPPRSLPDPVSPGLCRPAGAGSRGKGPRAVSHGQGSRPGAPDAVAQRDRQRTFAPHVPPLHSASAVGASKMATAPDLPLCTRQALTDPGAYLRLSGHYVLPGRCACRAASVGVCTPAVTVSVGGRSAPDRSPPSTELCRR
jgi:hypothetical protein